MEEKKKTLTLTLHANGIISHPETENAHRVAVKVMSLIYDSESRELTLNGDDDWSYLVDEHRSRQLMDAWIRGEHCEIEVEDEGP